MNLIPKREAEVNWKDGNRGGLGKDFSSAVGHHQKPIKRGQREPYGPERESVK